MIMKSRESNVAGLLGFLVVLATSCLSFTFIVLPLLILDSPVTNLTYFFYPIYFAVLAGVYFIPIQEHHFLPYWIGIVGLFCTFHNFTVYERKLAWQYFGAAPTPMWYPVIGFWQEQLTVWHTEANVIRGLFFVGLAGVLGVQIWKDKANGERYLSGMLPEVRYGDRMRMFHIVFASLAGFMLAEFMLPGIDLKFTLHHLACLLLCLVGSFWGWVPCVMWFALGTCVQEVGSMAYNMYFMYGMRNVYFYAMPISNVLSFIFLVKLWLAETPRREVYVFYLIALSMMIGRQIEWQKILL